MIYLIIPAYNEAKNLPSLIAGIARILTTGSYQAVIINDGSADTTLAVAQELAKTYPITVVDHGRNRGVAEAFRSGITHVTGQAEAADVAVIMEGDGTSSAELLPELSRKIAGGADLVIASRYQPGGRYKNFPMKRLVLSRGANIVFQLLFPIRHVRDYSIFYRAYRVGILQEALRRHGNQLITVQTFFANIELLLRVAPLCRRIEEIPLVYDYGKKQGKSGMKIGKNLRSYISFIIKNVGRSTN